jgi:predicted nucleotide-binding protein
LRRLNGPWSDHVLDTALDLVGATSGPRLLLIHGRSDDWLDLENWIRREVDRPVVVMGQEFGGGRTLPEKFEQLAGEVDGAIALATPDDLGGIDASDLPSRARQNVWVEVGWFWGRLGRDRLLLLRKTDVEFPSDLHGIEYYSYRHKPREVADSLRRFVTSLH